MQARAPRAVRWPLQPCRQTDRHRRKQISWVLPGSHRCSRLVGREASASLRQGWATAGGSPPGRTNASCSHPFTCGRCSPLVKNSLRCCPRVTEFLSGNSMRVRRSGRELTGTDENTDPPSQTVLGCSLCDRTVWQRACDPKVVGSTPTGLTMGIPRLQHSARVDVVRVLLGPCSRLLVPSL